MKLGRMRQRITLQNPTRTADGGGGYTETWASLNPAQAWARIRASSGRSGERNVSNTIVAQATHEVSMRFHPDVTTETRITWTDAAGRTRTINVTDVQDVDEAGIELVLSCVEVTGS